MKKLFTELLDMSLSARFGRSLLLRKSCIGRDRVKGSPLELQLDLKIYRHTMPEKRAAEDQVTLKFAKLTEHAYTPTRGTERSAGYDLYR